MIVRQIMRKDLVTITPSASVHDAASEMKKHNVGSVLVVDEGWKLKGILTDRDVAMFVARDSKDPRTTLAYDIMTPDPITVDSDADFDSALRIMNKANIRRLPVMENGKLAGIVSSADLAVEIRQQFSQFIGLEEVFAKHA